MPVTTKVIDEAFKLKLIITARDSTQYIDHAAARAHGIQIMNIMGLTRNEDQHSEVICTQVVEKNNHWLKDRKD